jgi:hypothetical protein
MRRKNISEFVLWEIPEFDLVELVGCLHKSSRDDTALTARCQAIFGQSVQHTKEKILPRDRVLSQFSTTLKLKLFGQHTRQGKYGRCIGICQPVNRVVTAYHQIIQKLASMTVNQCWYVL